VVYLRYRGRETRTRERQAATVIKPLHPVELWHAMASLLGSDARPSVPGGAKVVRAAAPEAGGEPARILVAEDGPVNARLVRTVLEDAGHEVPLVRDGAEALAAGAEDAYDAALIHMPMPDMDGPRSRAPCARRRARMHACRSVALTASAAAQARAECLAARMDEACGARDARALAATAVARLRNCAGRSLSTVAGGRTKRGAWRCAVRRRRCL